ncbi:transposase [Burkholderia sp. PU8-34]
MARSSKLDLKLPLSDYDWHRVSHLFENHSLRWFGRRHYSAREMLNAILWVILHNERWSRLPRPYGRWLLCYATWLRWRRHGIMSAIVIIYDLEEIVRVRQTMRIRF